MSKNKAATVHGEVEYETVTCDSCGAEVVKSDAKMFQIGKNLDSKYTRSVDVSGYACRHCADVGPAGFPGKDTLRNWFRQLDSYSQVLLVGSVTLSLAVVLGAVIA